MRRFIQRVLHVTTTDAMEAERAVASEMRRDLDDGRALVEGLRRDLGMVQQNTAQRFAGMQGQFGEIFEGVNHVVQTLNNMATAIEDVLARLKFYEENVTFLKLANKNYREKVRQDHERLVASQRATALREAEAAKAPSVAEMVATGPKIDALDVEGDAIMGTGELDADAGHNHD